MIENGIERGRHVVTSVTELVATRRLHLAPVVFYQDKVGRIRWRRDNGVVTTGRQGRARQRLERRPLLSITDKSSSNSTHTAKMICIAWAEVLYS